MARATLVAIVVLAAGLRLYSIANESPWWDEIVTLENLDAHNLVEFLSLERASDPPMTPVYFTLAWFWSRLTGPSVLSMRLLSVLLGLACIPVLYLITRRLFNVTAALFAALAFAVSLVHVYYAQEVRVYALVTLLALLSMYSIIRATRQPALMGRWLALNILFNALLAFTHLFALLIPASQALILAFWYHSNKRALALWGTAHAAIAVALALWLSTIDTSTIHDAASWMVQPGLRDVAMLLAVFAGGRPSNENPANHLPAGISLDLVLAVLMGGIIAWLVWTEMRRSRKMASPPCGPLLVWFLVPVIVLFAASYLWRPCFVYRYILFASLPLYVLFGAAIDRLNRRMPHKLFLASCMLLACVWGWQSQAVTAGPFRPDWTAVSRYLETHVGGDQVVVLQSINESALRYNSHLPQDQITRVNVWSDVAPAVEQIHKSGRNAFVALWLWTEPDNIENQFSQNNLPHQSIDFPGWPPLRVYLLPRR